jgi:hypothetical protein
MEGSVLQTICLGWPWAIVLTSSASQVAGITDVSHQHPAIQSFFKCALKIIDEAQFVLLPKLNS